LNLYYFITETINRNHSVI